MKASLRKLLFFLIRISGLPLLFYHTVQGKHVTVIYYHAPGPDSFKKHLGFITKHYNVVPMNRLADFLNGDGRKKLPHHSLIITFDDGHSSNYHLLPILRDYDIPVTIFLTAGVCGTDEPFWFLSKRFNGKEKEMLKKIPNNHRLKYLEETKRSGTVKNRQSLSWEEISEMKAVVDFQSHTLTHPCLPNCTDDIANMEITGSGELIEGKTGSRVYALCYPNGDYGERETEIARAAGYTMGFTGRHGFISPGDDLFSLKRISMNDTDDFNEFIVRVSGLWGWLKK